MRGETTEAHPATAAQLRGAPARAASPARHHDTPPTFAVEGKIGGSLGPLLEEISALLIGEGFVPAAEAGEADFVLNAIDPSDPRPFRRHSRGTFVAAIAQLPTQPADGLRETYPLLVRALANIVLCAMPGETVSFTTMERGYYVVEGDSVRPLAEQVVERLLPLARARLVIDNHFGRDLEHELWHGDTFTTQIAVAGKRLDRLGLLPAPFPIEELRDARPAPYPPPVRHRWTLLRQPLGATRRARASG